MRKNNNRFRGNNNNNNSGLNSRYDSLSPAGKVSGTALDLIKRYNELAKEAGAAGNYVEMEVFRQYAEHYRKILTELNERKNQNQAPVQTDGQTENAPKDENAASADAAQNNQTPENDASEPEVLKAKPLSLKRRPLKIVEVKETPNEEQAPKDETPKEEALKEEAPKAAKAKRVSKRKAKEEKEPASDAVAS